MFRLGNPSRKARQAVYLRFDANFDRIQPPVRPVLQQKGKFERIAKPNERQNFTRFRHRRYLSNDSKTKRLNQLL